MQGRSSNCYFLAALAGLAEDVPEKRGTGERIRDNFLTKEVNSAGIFAVQFYINGESLIVCVDDWFPFYKNHKGEEKFAFARQKNEDEEEK
jgi:hypothetical protein